jgi:hypothetical protein
LSVFSFLVFFVFLLLSWKEFIGRFSTKLCLMILYPLCYERVTALWDE